MAEEEAVDVVSVRVVRRKSIVELHQQSLQRLALWVREDRSEFLFHLAKDSPRLHTQPLRLLGKEDTDHALTLFNLVQNLDQII